MKNLLLIVFLSIGLFSFKSVTNETDNDIIVAQSTWLVDYNVINNLPPFTCTATVTYGGVFVTNFTGTGATAGEACANAATLACDYIQQQGGTCPEHQL